MTGLRRKFTEHLLIVGGKLPHVPEPLSVRDVGDQELRVIAKKVTTHGVEVFRDDVFRICIRPRTVKSKDDLLQDAADGPATAPEAKAEGEENPASVSGGAVAEAGLTALRSLPPWSAGPHASRFQCHAKGKGWPIHFFGTAILTEVREARAPRRPQEEGNS